MKGKNGKSERHHHSSFVGVVIVTDEGVFTQWKKSHIMRLDCSEESHNV